MLNPEIRQAKILIVDDQEANIEVLKYLLEGEGYGQVSSTNDSRLVVELYKTLNPDLILLDLVMPFLDGYAILEQLQPLIPAGNYLPILVLTADITPAAKQRALRSGAMDFLTKPLDMVEVALRIRNLLETRFLHLRLQNQNQTLEAEVAKRTANLTLANTALTDANIKLETEIGERAKAEVALRESEARFRSMFEHSDNVMLLIEPESGRILDANSAAVDFYGYPIAKMRTMLIEALNVLSPAEIAGQRKSAAAGLQNDFYFPHRLASGEVRIVEVHSSPIVSQGQAILFSIIYDVTERQLTEKIMRARVKLIETANSKSADELVQITIDQAELLTDSQMGFFHFIGADENSLTQQHWSGRTLPQFNHDESRLHASINQAGLWAESIRQRQAVVHNDYAALASLTGLPATHATISRELVVPITREKRIVGALGIANKLQDYTYIDVELVSRLADLAWDILESKRTDESLQRAHLELTRSEEKYRGLADNALVGVYQTSVAGEFLYANDSLATVLGYSSAAELSRINARQVYRHQDERLEIIARLQSTGQIVNHEVEMVTKSGEARTMLLSMTHDQDLLSGMIIDITERKLVSAALLESETRLAGIIGSAMDGIIGVDTLGNIALFNPAAEAIFGYGAAQVMGKPFSLLVPVRLKEGYLKFFEKLLNTDLNRATTERLLLIRGLRADGSEFPGEVSIAPAEVANGQLFTVVLRDITARVQMEQAEREQRELAEALRDTAAAMNSTLNYEEVLDRTLVNIARLVPYSAAQIALLDDGRLGVVRTRVKEETAAGQHSLPGISHFVEHSLIRAAAQNQQALVISDTASDEYWSDRLVNDDIRSFMVAPLALHQKALGLLLVVSDVAGQFLPKHAEWLKAFADQAAQAISNAQLYDTLKSQANNIDQLYRQEAQRAGHAAALSNLLQALNATTHLTDAFAELFAGLGAICACDFASLGFINYNSVESEKRGAELRLFDLQPKSVNTELRFNAKDTSALADVASGRPHYTADLTSDREHLVEAWLYNQGWRSRLCLPLHSNRTFIGLLNVGWRKPVSDPAAVSALLVQIANAIALAVEKNRLLSETRDHLLREQRLGNITRTISSTLNLDEILESVIRQAANLLEADAGAIGLLSNDGQSIHYPCIFNLPSDAALISQPRGKGLAWEIMESGRASVISNYAQHPNALPQWVRVGVKAAGIGPISIGDRCIGILELYTLSFGKSLASRGVEFIESVGRQIGVAIQNARLFEETRNRALELEALYGISSSLRSAETLPDMYTIILKYVAKTLEATAASLSLVDRTTSDLVTELAIGDWVGLNQLRLPSGQGFGGTVVSTHKPYLTDNVLGDPLFTLGGSSDLISMSPQAVFVPLVVHDQTIGVLGAGRRKEFADADTSLLAALADIAANAIRRATLHDQTRQRAEQLAAINTLSHALAEILSLPQIYEQLHQAILQLLPASTAIYISLRNATTNVSQCVYAAHGSNLVEPAIGAAEFAFDQLEIGQGEAIRLRQPVALNDLGAPGGVLKSGLFAPMMVKGQVVGVIHVQTDSPDHYNEGETEILSLMANTAAIAIENATLVSELQGSIEELQTAQGRLIQSARLSAVGELAAGVAHQINNPLTTIIADAQLLTRSINNDHPGAASAAAIYQAGWRAQRVVKQLLNFARPDQGELKATNLNETIQEAMELVGAHMGRGGAKVEIELGKNIPLILANGHQLQEVWLNLLMNAHDALLPDRPGLIRLETSLDADKQSVIVTIADNGRGIAESDGSNLFTLFFTTKGEGRGNGLGLSVCQRIVRSHGGEISFQSQVGQGTTFVVTLPLKPLP